MKEKRIPDLDRYRNPATYHAVSHATIYRRIIDSNFIADLLAVDKMIISLSSVLGILV